VFLFIGRLLKDKGILEYVEAAKRLQEKKHKIVCWVLGGLDFGNPAHIHQAQVSDWKKKKHIKYLGTSEDVRPIIAKAHAIVLPSYREGMPRAILEAMSMGKPIITTDVAGCSETVEDGENGYKVPLKNEGALYDAMLKLSILKEYERYEMGAKSREIVMERFEKSVIQNKFIALIKEIVPFRPVNELLAL
jgi:glycosyltransferase involved in cell wall biosynthesis